MEREEISEGGGIGIRGAVLDVQELGNGKENPVTISPEGASAPTSKYTEHQRAVRRAASLRWRQNNSERFKAANPDRKRFLRRIDGGEKQRKIHSAWRELNRDRLRQQYREYRIKNLEKRTAQAKAHRASWSEEKKAQVAAYQKSYRAANAEKRKQSLKEWHSKNSEHVKQKQKEYLPRRLALNRQRRAADPIQRLKDASRTRVGFILRKAGIPKFNHTFDLVGCTPDFLKAHIENQFKPGMSWNNYGDWEIDHKHPLAAFDLSDKTQLYAAFHYSNCQPLWKIENRIKNAKLPS